MAIIRPPTHFITAPRFGMGASGTVGTGVDPLLWSGDVDDGTFLQWASENMETTGQMQFFGCPTYGRPPAYSPTNIWHTGRGECLWIAAKSEAIALQDTSRLGWGPNYSMYQVGPEFPGTDYVIGVRVASRDDDWHTIPYTGLTKTSDTTFSVLGDTANGGLDAARLFNQATVSATQTRQIRMQPGNVVAVVRPGGSWTQPVPLPPAVSWDSTHAYVEISGAVVPDGLNSIDINWKSVLQPSVGWPTDNTNGNTTDVKGDYDGFSGRHRTELRGLNRHFEQNLIPYQTTRWISWSCYLPENWDNSNREWAFVTMLQFKPSVNTGSSSPFVSISQQGDGWHLPIHTATTVNPVTADFTVHRFTHPDNAGPGNTIQSSPHYPNDHISMNALNTLTRGAWTHWVIQLHNDGRLSTEGGQGVVNIWKRDADGPWIHVLNFYATPDYPACFPQSNANMGFHCSNYMGLAQTLTAPVGGRTYWAANIKLSSEIATLSDMTHDGSDTTTPSARMVDTTFGGVDFTSRTTWNYDYMTGTDSSTGQVFSGAAVGDAASPKIFDLPSWSGRPPSLHRIAESLASWTTSTSYDPGNGVQTISGYYVCVQGGISAAAGFGPMGTGSNIVDGTGTLRWDYVAPSGTDYAEAFWQNSIVSGVNGPDGTSTATVLRRRRMFDMSPSVSGNPQCNWEFTAVSDNPGDQGMIYMRIKRRIRGFGGWGINGNPYDVSWGTHMGQKLASGAEVTDGRMTIGSNNISTNPRTWTFGIGTSMASSAYTGGLIWQGREAEVWPQAPDHYYVNTGTGRGTGSGETFYTFGVYDQWDNFPTQAPEPDWDAWATIVMAYRLESTGPTYNWVSGNLLPGGGWCYYATCIGTGEAAAPNSSLKSRFFLRGPTHYDCRYNDPGSDAAGLFFVSSHYGPGVPTNYDLELGSLEIFDHWPEDHPIAEIPEGAD